MPQGGWRKKGAAREPGGRSAEITRFRERPESAGMFGARNINRVAASGGCFTSSHTPKKKDERHVKI